MAEVDTSVQDRLRYVAGLLVRKLEKVKDPEAIEAISFCLQAFLHDLRAAEEIPTQSAYAELAKKVSDLESWQQLVRAKLGVTVVSRAGDFGAM